MKKIEVQSQVIKRGESKKKQVKQQHKISTMGSGKDASSPTKEELLSSASNLTASSSSLASSMFVPASLVALVSIAWIQRDALQRVAQDAWQACQAQEEEGTAFLWPPSAACIVHVTPWILLVLVGVVGMALASILFGQVKTQEEIELQQQQSNRRHETVEEMVEELEETEDLTSDQRGGVWCRILLDAVDELVEIPKFKKETLHAGVRWTLALLDKELRVASDKTAEGQDLEFCDGNKLEELLEHYWRVRILVRRSGYTWPHKERRAIHQRYRHGWKVYRVHGWKGVWKACKLILTSENALIWVALHAVITTIHASIQATSWIYRAQVLQQMASNDTDGFWQAAKAMLLVELLNNYLHDLTRILAFKGEDIMALELQVSFFDALMKMDISWWNMQTRLERPADMYTVTELAYSVPAFMAMPTSTLEQITTLFTHAFLLFRASSSALYWLGAVNVISTLLTRGAYKLTDLLFRLVERGIVYPNSEDFSFFYALDSTYISTFQSFVRGEKERQRFEEYCRFRMRNSKRSTLVDFVADPFTIILRQAASVSQFFIGRKFVSNGAGVMEADGLIQKSQSIVSLGEALLRIVKEVVETAQPLANAYDLMSLPKPIDPDKGLWPKESTKGHIQFEHVRFKYPTRDAEVLRGVNFEALPGETVGLTGSAGCGKSTALRLLERFFDVTEGKILLDGVDIRDYNPRWLRGQIATVAQEPVLLPTTVRDNIIFGCPHHPTIEEIHQACRDANIYDSLMDKEKFPSGLRTKLDAIPNISGGEKQRIALARAFLANPKILLLDEATSALDEENQEKVQQALNRLMKNRTTLVIAHRLSTIKDSDKIVAFNKGKVVECGSHDELVKNPQSIYGMLWQKQSTTRSSANFDDLSSGDIQTTDDEEQDDDEGKWESEQVALGPTTEYHNTAAWIAGGMNPPPSVKTRLERLEARLARMPQSDMTAEFAALAQALKTEATNLAMAKQEPNKLLEARRLGMKVTAVNRWKKEVTETKESKPKLKKLARKLIFKTAHQSSLGLIEEPPML